MVLGINSEVLLSVTKSLQETQKVTIGDLCLCHGHVGWGLVFSSYHHTCGILTGQDDAPSHKLINPANYRYVVNPLTKWLIHR